MVFIFEEKLKCPKNQYGKPLVNSETQLDRQADIHLIIASFVYSSIYICAYWNVPRNETNNQKLI